MSDDRAIEARERASQALYDMSRGQQWPGVVSGIPTTHVGTTTVVDTVLEALASAGFQITDDGEAWRTVWMESVPKKRTLAHASKSLDRIHGIARAHLPGAGGSGG